MTSVVSEPSSSLTVQFITSAEMAEPSVKLAVNHANVNKYSNDCEHSRFSGMVVDDAQPGALHPLRHWITTCYGGLNQVLHFQHLLLNNDYT
jgi:hypothetical protein